MADVRCGRWSGRRTASDGTRGEAGTVATRNPATTTLAALQRARLGTGWAARWHLGSSPGPGCGQSLIEEDQALRWSEPPLVNPLLVATAAAISSVRPEDSGAAPNCHVGAGRDSVRRPCCYCHPAAAGFARGAVAWEPMHGRASAWTGKRSSATESVLEMSS